jgi:DNA-binding transcriptional LysR family regulator
LADWPFDPGLLLSLDALLQDKHVSRAALRVGVTQPAMSRVLARLRAQLGDPILVRSGRSMTLSPRAEAMAVESATRRLPALSKTSPLGKFMFGSVAQGSVTLPPPGGSL